MVALLDNIQIFSVNSLFILTSIVLFVWYYLNKKASYWNDRGVPSISPATCFLNTLKFTVGLEPVALSLDELYKKLEGHKFGGTFQFTGPSLLLRDPEIIKSVLVKGFSSFHDREVKPKESYDDLPGTLSQQTGEKWHQLRRRLSPAFSAAKMKVMFQSLQSCAKDLNMHLQKLCSATGDAEVNVKELMSDSTLNVIGACAMGVDCDAIRNPDSEVKRIMMQAAGFGIRGKILLILDLINPKILQFFRVTPRSAEFDEFLTTICRDAMETKKTEKSSTKNNFLQILMNLQSDESEKSIESKKNLAFKVESSENLEGPVLTKNVLMSMMSAFMFGGFQPVAAALTFCLYELALHPEVQENIFKEIQTVQEEGGDDISYEDLKKMQYTDQVVNETLRKYSVAGIASRNCNEPFKMPDSSLVVEKNVRIFIPIHSLHYDPRYFPEPGKFDPDRFSEANMDKIVPGSYLPFGDGPRFCIAMRFVQLDIKTIVTTLVSEYTLHPCSKTSVPIEFGSGILLAPKGELWLRMQKR